MKWSKSFAMLLMCLGLAAANDAGTKVDNPEFKSWHDHNVGTNVTFVTTLTREGAGDIKSEEVGTLIEKSADECKIEMAVKTIMPAGRAPFPKFSRLVPAKTDQGKEYLPDGFEGTFKIVGQETVTIAGKKYDCKIVTFEGSIKTLKATGRCWLSDEVPGLQVIGEMSGEDEGVKLSSRSVLKSVEIK